MLNKRLRCYALKCIGEKVRTRKPRNMETRFPPRKEIRIFMEPFKRFDKICLSPPMPKTVNIFPVTWAYHQTDVRLSIVAVSFLCLHTVNVPMKM